MLQTYCQTRKSQNQWEKGFEPTIEFLGKRRDKGSHSLLWFKQIQITKTTYPSTTIMGTELYWEDVWDYGSKTPHYLSILKTIFLFFFEWSILKTMHTPWEKNTKKVIWAHQYHSLQCLTPKKSLPFWDSNVLLRLVRCIYQ